ncbi:anti-sigma factor family protein [Paracraurococcus lichenis]|uniref:Zf-HC2 domain-containing protein n=1 Tax=Paracraurococcus lichenis TaxID=3064888 RepID=A0ABT9ECH7_9PROT|nr:zf-HC2 domain-containing protein [Paracraurococcus sp. LOR1-02]MDO9713917.1 zf-HC2 domain-containing protein [Paracraurococcus sp. LOR1-02]
MMSGSRDEARCAGMDVLLHALADGELDAANALRCEAHLHECPACASAFAEIGAWRAALRRDGVRHQAPERLRGRILAMAGSGAPAWQPETAMLAAPDWLRRPLRVAAAAVGGAQPASPRRRSWPWNARWPALALAAGLAATVAVVVQPRVGPDDGEAATLQREVVASHIRSLLVPGRLEDVASSDRHTVKPWFAGRLDFSPPTPDLAEAGFPLAGGRLDYLDGHTVAALIYRRRGHVINLFVWPGDAAGAPIAPHLAGHGGGRDGGHAVVHWTQGGMTFWAVSDLNGAELVDFARLFSARAQDPAPPA